MAVFVQRFLIAKQKQDILLEPTQLSHNHSLNKLLFKIGILILFRIKIKRSSTRILLYIRNDSKKAVNILDFENPNGDPTLENHNMADRRESADAEPELRPDPQFWQQ